TSRRVLAVLTLLALDRSAAAEGTDKAVAEALFQRGRALVAEGKIAEACTKFAESQRIEAKIGTLLNLADCHERQERTATAWAEYSEAFAQALRADQKERQDFAEERIRALEKRLSRLRIESESPLAGMSASIDGVHLGAAVFDTPVPVDPGDH